MARLFFIISRGTYYFTVANEMKYVQKYAISFYLGWTEIDFLHKLLVFVLFYIFLAGNTSVFGNESKGVPFIGIQYLKIFKIEKQKFFKFSKRLFIRSACWIICYLVSSQLTCNHYI